MMFVISDVINTELFHTILKTIDTIVFQLPSGEREPKAVSLLEQCYDLLFLQRRNASETVQ